MRDEQVRDSAGAARPHVTAARTTGVVRHEVDVRFQDLDAMGHAHHSLPLVYVEEARAQWWRGLTGRDGIEGIDYVLAEVRVRFHARIRYPARLSIELRVTDVGRKSFEMGFVILDEEGETLASGSTVQVMYDYAARASKAIPSALRRQLEVLHTADQKASPIPAETSPIIAPST